MYMRFISCKCRCYIMTTRMYQGFSYMVVRGYPQVNKSRGQVRGVRKAIRREGVKCELEGNNFTIIK